MPLYDYSCSECGKIIEVIHPMSEIDNPSEATVKEITCNNEHEPVLMKRYYQQGHGGIAKFNGLSKGEKRKMLKQRATNHFNSEIKEQKHEKWRELRNEIKNK